MDVGPFHKSFSSIVGPNGSGKSNVIDAMLFIFGRRAKQLRHSKLSELLHNSSTHPNVTHATVTVYFHEIVDTGSGDDDYFVVEGSEFEVARRAFRNNTSKYYLDEREVKMTEVVELLKGKGVDLDNNRFLILQGEVEQIAMMKPKGLTQHEDGLLEYLEDIIGSNRHIETIEALTQKVETLNEEREHKMARTKVAERERDSLDDAKHEAENYLDKETEMLTKKIRLGISKHYDTKQTLKENVGKLKEAEDNIKKFHEDVTGKEKAMKNLEKGFHDTQKKLDSAVIAMNDTKEKYAAFERKNIKLSEDIKALKGKARKLEASKGREMKRAEESRVKAEECAKEKEDAETRITEVNESLHEAQHAFDKVRDQVRKKTAPIRDKLETKQAELLPFSEKVNECRKELEVAQSELNLLVGKLEAPEKNLSTAEESLREMESNLHDTKQTLQTTEREAFENTETAKQCDRKMSEKQAVLRDLSAQCSGIRRRVEEAKSAREFSHTRSRLHSSILSASNSRRLDGVVGRLGDLASVDGQYATAVSAAAGSNLDNIVVQTADNAQACIQFLRRENLGRATFIILEKVQYLQGPIEGWGRSDRGSDGPRLFDYLNIPNPQNRVALYYALRDTLVARTLEEARRMAFKPSRQNRVVTLAGELIESSGAMTGGGRGPTRYRLGSGRSSEGEMDPAAFQALCSSLDEARGHIVREEQEMHQIENARTEASSKAENLEMQVTRAKLEVRSLEERSDYMRTNTIPALQKAVADSMRLVQQKKCPDTKRKFELEKDVKKHEKELSGAKAACQDLEAEIVALQEEIVAAGGKKLENAKSALEECRNDLSELRSVVSTAASRTSAAEKASFKAREAAGNAESESVKVKEDIIKTKAELETMLDEAQEVQDLYQETEKVHKEWVAKVEKAQEGYSITKNELKKLRRGEVSLLEQSDSLTRLVEDDRHELRSLEKAQKSMKKKLDRLALMSVDVPVQESQVDTASPHDTESDENEDDQDNAMEVETEKDDKDDDSDGTAHKLSISEKKQLRAEISVLESELASMNPNLGAIAEYQRKDVEYKNQVNELDELIERRDSAKRECDTLRKKRLDEFMSGFSNITLKLKELYQMITLGGDAELELVDSLDPFSEGIVFSVRPPKKSWKNISNLSGGEKTLSSLALVFALHHFKPTPLYFLDEIDAALDYKNVSIVANYVKDRTKNAQFIIISLRNNMFELADRLVGIYKTHNTTKSVTVDPSAFVMPSISDRPKQVTSTS